MFFKKIQQNIIPLGLIVFSSLFGIRLINEYLKFNDRMKYEFESSSRLLKNGSKLHVSHPKNYNINSTGKNTIIFVSDSFGEGRKLNKKSR